MKSTANAKHTKKIQKQRIRERQRPETRKRTINKTVTEKNGEQVQISVRSTTLLKLPLLLQLTRESS